MCPREQLKWVEVEIATMVWRGKTNPEIGQTLHTSEQVIKNHLRSIFDKLGVWSRLELALYVAAHGGNCWADEGQVGESATPERAGPALPAEL